MNTLSGIFPTAEAANKAKDALSEAGIRGDSVTVTATDDGDKQLVSADIDDNALDAAQAIFNQAGASDINSVNNSAETVEGEARGRLDEEIVPLAGANR